MFNDIHLEYLEIESKLKSTRIREKDREYYLHQKRSYEILKAIISQIYPYLLLELNNKTSSYYSEEVARLFLIGQIKGFIDLKKPLKDIVEIDSFFLENIDNFQEFISCYIDAQLLATEKNIGHSFSYKNFQINAMIDFYKLLFKIKKEINKRIISCQKPKLINKIFHPSILQMFQKLKEKVQ